MIIKTILETTSCAALRDGNNNNARRVAGLAWYDLDGFACLQQAPGLPKVTDPIPFRESEADERPGPAGASAR